MQKKPFKAKLKFVYPPVDNGSTFVSPEKVDVKNIYSITINPANQYELDQDRLIRVISDTYKSLKTCLYSGYSLRVELSQKGRIHFHGYMRVYDVAMCYLFDVDRLIKIGHTEMDTINDDHVWETYINKSQNYMKELLESNVNLNEKQMLNVYFSDDPLRYFNKEH